MEVTNILEFLKVPNVALFGFDVNALTAVVVAMVLAITAIAVRARGLSCKVGAVALFLAMAPVLFVALAEQLSHPKELSLKWVQQQGQKGMRVHSVVIRPPEKIYLWLDINGTPRAFWIPWSKPLERSLRRALEQWGDGRNGMLRFRFQPSLETEPRFYMMPWPAPPPKDAPPVPRPYMFNGPGQEA